jgi:hypothetical protein
VRTELYEEAAKVGIERRADVDRVGEARAEPREEAANGDEEWLAVIHGGSGEIPSTEGRPKDKAGSAEEDIG